MKSEKIFIGPKLRALRASHKLTQSALANQLDVSASYINLMEANQRSASFRFLINLCDSFGLDWRDFTEKDSDLIVADLRQITRDPIFGDQKPDIEELRAAIDNSPTLLRGFINVYNAYRNYEERLAAAEESNANSQTDGEQGVHDFFRAKGNYFDTLERSAEHLRSSLQLRRDENYTKLKSYLSDAHGITVRTMPVGDHQHRLRIFDRHQRRVWLSNALDHNNRVFQLAHVIALIAFDHELSEILDDVFFSDEHRRGRSRVELANYFAAALLMPYQELHDFALAVSYDIDAIAAHFSVSFEQVCHRLTNLNRPGTKGVPFFFLRIDKGGNVSKRLNAAPIQLARFGGTCPRLDIHYSLRVPGRILTQVVEMPDGNRFVTINRTVDRPVPHYSTEDRRLAVALGCSIEHASSLIYTKHLDLTQKDLATPIGVNCRLCPRQYCEQRAHESVSRTSVVDENQRGATRFE